MDPIIPIVRKEPFDDPAWLFDLKYEPVRAEEKKAAVLAILADQLPDQAKLVSL